MSAGKAVMQDIRWRQRFANFDRPVLLLREPIERGVETLSDLEKERAVQRFEVAVELAWKTLKDYMEHEGAVIDPVTPRNVLKAAFAARIVQVGQVWIDMLDHRSVLSHTYSSAAFETAVLAMRDRYLAAIADLHSWLSERVTHG